MMGLVIQEYTLFLVLLLVPDKVQPFSERRCVKEVSYGDLFFACYF